VAASNRSVAYSSVPASPPAPSHAWSSRSSWAVSVSKLTRSTPSPAKRSPSAGALSRTNITCERGWRDGSRSGCSSSTRRSKGRSWCSCASSMVRRTRPSSSRKVGSPERSVRRRSVLTKQPMSPAVSGRSRWAAPELTTTSCSPEQRESSTLNADRSTRCSVAFSRAASDLSASPSSRGSSKRSRAPRKLRAAGRGRSAGSSSTAGAPASRSRQKASCRSSSSPESRSRCHAAKSAYCTGSSGSRASSPCESAA
jgi:hypothetical protein